MNAKKTLNVRLKLELMLLTWPIGFLGSLMDSLDQLQSLVDSVQERLINRQGALVRLLTSRDKR